MLKKLKNTHGYVVCSIVLMLVLAAVLTGCAAPNDVPPSTSGSDVGVTPQPIEAEPTPQEASAGDAAQGDDLVIPVSDISEKATFYPVEIDGTKLEVLAVKAPDGSIRTAFNTCQVCYDSGRGYYKQDGDVLVCQNCGNRFSMDQVEVVSGGCNPVPIFPENKIVEDESITIPYAFLSEAKVIFANWKTEY
jgi:uncharacterized membrane protein